MRSITYELKYIRRIFHSILIEEMLSDLLKSNTLEELTKQLQIQNRGRKNEEIQSR